MSQKAKVPQHNVQNSNRFSCPRQCRSQPRSWLSHARYHDRTTMLFMTFKRFFSSSLTLIIWLFSTSATNQLINQTQVHNAQSPDGSLGSSAHSSTFSVLASARPDSKSPPPPASSSFPSAVRTNPHTGEWPVKSRDYRDRETTSRPSSVSSPYYSPSPAHHVSKRSFDGSKVPEDRYSTEPIVKSGKHTNQEFFHPESEFQRNHTESYISKDLPRVPGPRRHEAFTPLEDSQQPGVIF